MYIKWILDWCGHESLIGNTLVPRSNSTENTTMNNGSIKTLDHPKPDINVSIPILISVSELIMCWADSNYGLAFNATFQKPFSKDIMINLSLKAFLVQCESG